ncbi:MAG: hypothetical protein ABI164_07345 [Acidobacteriaceae bacterium]
MPHQQDLFPPEASESANSRAPKPPKPPAPIWLQRLSIVILVVFCFYIGLLLFLLPWTRYWQQNHYLLTLPSLGPLLNSGITRGVISGLGLIDVWIGISEVIHYREHRA